MQLTRHTDYALRLLLYLAHQGENRVSIAAVAAAQDISRTHLMKITNGLVHAGFVEATRGRGGGIRLARAPGEINLGAVVQAMEPRCALIDCTGCQLIRSCGLPAILAQAAAAFYGRLAGSSLADVIKTPF
jgi:Rrf2 family nitric oxide-sensitive transcriptional repressor